MSPHYNNVNTIAEAELAGCLPVTEDPNNFELLRDNLVMRIALYYKREPADLLCKVIKIEACEVQVPLWEYIINELQYEFRVAAAHGPEKLNQEYESRLINQWARHVIRRNDVDTSLEFITVLKANRLKRTR